MSTKQQQQPISSSHKEEVPNGDATVAHEETYQKSWIIGGKHREQLYEEQSQDVESRLVQEVDFDLPLTATKPTEHNGQNYIVLEFAEGDKENPFNWNGKYKAFISVLLCAMTLFIGLATTAYSAGISRMTEEFGVSTEIGPLMSLPSAISSSRALHRARPSSSPTVSPSPRGTFVWQRGRSLGMFRDTRSRFRLGWRGGWLGALSGRVGRRG